MLHLANNGLERVNIHLFYYLVNKDLVSDYVCLFGKAKIKYSLSHLIKQFFSKFPFLYMILILIRIISKTYIYMGRVYILYVLLYCIYRICVYILYASTCMGKVYIYTKVHYSIHLKAYETTKHKNR